MYLSMAVSCLARNGATNASYTYSAPCVRGCHRYTTNATFASLYMGSQNTNRSETCVPAVYSAMTVQ